MTGGRRASQVDELLSALAQSYAIRPRDVDSSVVTIACIVMQVPAIPSVFAFGVLLAIGRSGVVAGADLGVAVAAANTGVGERDGLRGARQPVLHPEASKRCCRPFPS